METDLELLVEAAAGRLCWRRARRPASLVVHNLPAGDRPGAVREMLRVLAPGGRLVILDFQATADYERELPSAGVEGVRRSGRHWTMHLPVRIVTAVVPLLTTNH